MSISNYAIVTAEGVVENVVVWDGNAETWQAPTGTTAVEVSDTTGPAYIGGRYSDGTFTAPATPSESTTS